MIQPVPASPIPAAASLPLPGETVVATAGEMAETLDFSALLALESEAGEAIGAAIATIAAPNRPGQTLAAEVAETGKILPPVLSEEAADQPQVESTFPEAEEAGQPVAAIAHAPVAPPSMPLPEQGLSTEQPVADASAPRQLPALAAHAAVAALMRRPEAAQPIRTMANNPPQLGETSAETTVASLPALAIASARKTSAMPIPTEEVRLDLSRLVPVQPRGELRLPVESALPASGTSEGLAATAQPMTTYTGLQIANPGIQPSQAPVRPHDFSALIDRLTSARDAMVPHSVAITVAHQDFGPVRLRFRNEDTGLSVAITSADPGFARAAAAAPLPVLPGSSADQSGFTPQRGDSGQAQAGNSSSSNNSGSSGRDASPDRQAGQRQSARHSASDRANDPADARRGIFA